MQRRSRNVEYCSITEYAARDLLGSWRLATQIGRWAAGILAIVAVTTMAAAGALHQIWSPFAASEPAPPPAGTHVWVSPSGNDSTCLRDDSSHPCATFAKARTMADCGEIVSVASGSYSSQTISGGADCALGNEVTFLNSSGTATLAGLAIPSIGVVVDHMHINSGVLMQDRLTIQNSYIYGGFDAYGVSYWTIDNDELDGHAGTNAQNIWDSPSGVGNQHWSVTNSDMHDFYNASNPSAHTQALYIGGYSNDGLVASNTFENNGNTSHIFLTWFGDCACSGLQPTGGDPQNICIRDNTFGSTAGAYFDINTRDEITTSTTVNLVYDTDNSYSHGVDQSEFLGDCG